MGAVLLQTHGTMNISIADPMRFLKKFAIGKPITRVGDIKDSLQTKLLGELTVLLMGTEDIDSVPDANRFLSQLEGGMLAKLSEQFENEFGVQINALDANPFRAKQASPDEIMNYVSLENYERIKRLNIAETAAGNEGLAGGLAGAGVGFGVGQNIGSAMNPQAAEQQQNQQMMQNMMMQQMMQMMQNQQGQQNQPQQQQQAPAGGGGGGSSPKTKEEIQAAIDKLDMRLMNGEISESIYNRLLQKWQSRLDNL
jgi:membrane protease subunit (stomatin/prohibitin family)